MVIGRVAFLAENLPIRLTCHSNIFFSLRAKSFHPSIVAGIHQASARFQKLLPDVKTFTNDKVSCHPMSIHLQKIL